MDLPKPAPETRVPPHVERALITLTTKMQQYIERLEVLEHRMDQLAEASMNTPSHSDVMEVRMHSAKLAAELARATVELRGEIGMASDEARRQARATRNEMMEAPLSMPVDIEIEKAQPRPDIEFAEEQPAPQQQTDHRNWSQTA